MIRPNSIVFDNASQKYQVIDFLGRGSFGEVYSIRETKSNALFALKTLATPFVEETILKSFVNEGRLAQDIEHPNVIKYYYFHDGDEFKELPMYIIMQYADSGTLEDNIKERAKNNQYFNSDELLQMFKQLISGMRAINSKLIHRDIKPDNILIHENNLMISDFGLSKIVTQATRTSTFKGIGCLPFLAPEGWKFDKNTIQMDIYSMGIVFYELSSLAFPYQVSKGDFEDWQKAHLFQNPINVEKINTNISPIISRLIMKMIEKDSKQRPKSLDEIESYLEKESLPQTDNTEIINKVLISRNEKTQKATQERLQREQREKEISQFKDLVLAQYHKDFINPIKEFIEEINNKSDGSNITCNFDTNSFLNTITYNIESIKINFIPIIKENFYREVSVKDYRMTHTRLELKLPKVYDTQVKAWGLLKAKDGRGFNIILLENPESVYGDWMLLFNHHRASVVRQDNRPDPFPFEMNEIEEELTYLNAMHIYVTEKYGLDLDRVKSFLSEYF